VGVRIAYKSDALDVKPEDFVVFTVVHDCPKRQRETIEIPHLPACPDGKCICVSVVLHPQELWHQELLHDALRVQGDGG